MMRFFALFAFAVFALAVFAAGPACAGPPRQAAPLASGADPAARELLRRMLQAENSLPLAGSQTTVVVRGGLDISSEQQVQRRGAGALRLDYLRPARLAGEQVIDNGRFFCRYLPSENTLELSPSRVHSLRVRVPQVIGEINAGRLGVQAVGTETIAGHLCTVLQVRVQSSGPVPFQKFWVDPANGAQLRNEQYDSAGRLRSASYYTQVVYNPVFDPAAFRIPKRGGKVVTTGFAAPTLSLDEVRGQAAFPVLSPAALPAGFRYQGGSVSSRGAAQVAALRFWGGGGGLSVFETPDDRPSGASKPEHPRHGVLFGRQNGLKIVIVGNLENAELDALMASLK